MAKSSSGSWGVYDPRGPRDVGARSVVSDKPYWWNQGLPNTPPSIDGYPEISLASRRDGYSSSPVYTIPGTSSKGRKPTAYSRHIFSQVTLNELEGRERGKSPAYRNRWITTPASTSAWNTSVTNRGDKYKAMMSSSVTSTWWTDVDMANDLNRAVTECLVKLGDNKVDMGVALAESVKTVRHLADTSKDLYGSVLALKRRNFKGLLNILSKRSPLHNRKVVAGKTAASYWLEYNYAWKPLINEAHGLVELLKTQLEPALLVHANRTIERKFESHVPWGTSAGPWYTINYRGSGKIKHSATCRLTGKVRSSALRKLSQGLTNPAVIAWELVPYSFVVDWAIPIGNVLEAATATQGLDFVWGSSTQRYFTDGEIHFKTTAIPVITPGYAKFYKFALRRSVYTSFPRPVLYAKSPFSSSHLTSALALLRQLF